MHWGVPAREVPQDQDGVQVLSGLTHGLEVLKLVQQKQRLFKDTWLMGTGHKRPGMKQDIPLEEAER
jgi:hypothetical protein